MAAIKATHTLRDYNAGITLSSNPLTSHLPVLEVTSSPQHSGSHNSRSRAQTDPRTETSTTVGNQFVFRNRKVKEKRKPYSSHTSNNQTYLHFIPAASVQDNSIPTHKTVRKVSERKDPGLVSESCEKEEEEESLLSTDRE